MSGRIFQNSVLQFKETTDRTIGVIDAEGTVIACSELTAIGKKWGKYVEPIIAADGSCVALEGKYFKALPSWSSSFDYAVFATGDDSMSRTVCAMAAVALNAAKSYYEEKHDKGSFIKNIISDNILISDIYMRAKELHVDAEVARGVEKVAINFYKGIVNRQNHEREIIIDHTDNYRRRGIHDAEIRQIQRREDIVENTVIREQHPYSYYPEQEVYPHGQDENKYNEAAVFRGAFAEYQRERISEQQAHHRCYHCEQQGQPERLNMNLFKNRCYV